MREEPEGPLALHEEAAVSQEVAVDNVWATPSGLHMRVTVWSRDKRYRHKYECFVPVAEISSEAVSALFALTAEEDWREDLEDIPLF